jgi:hypothetical protein
LDKKNADHWIGIASKHSKKEINELVKKHLVASGEAMAGGSTATRSWAKALSRVSFRHSPLRSGACQLLIARRASSSPDARPCAVQLATSG